MFVDQTLAAQLEQAEAELTRQYAEAYARVYPQSGAVSVEAAGGRVSFAGPGSPLSRAEALGLNGPVPAETMDAVEAFLTSRGATPTLDTCPFTHQTLFGLAGQRRYRVEHVLNVFVLPLVSCEQPGAEPVDSGPKVSIREVSKSPEDSDAWCLTAGRGFASIDAGGPPYMDIYRGIFHAAGTTGFLATIDGRPAGAGALKLAGKIAYLSTSSTLPSCRKRGVQTALISARLKAAARHGCELAAIVTSPGSNSERNVLRAGFTMAYARIRLSKAL